MPSMGAFRRGVIDDMNETPTIFKWKYKMDKMAGGIVVDKDYGVLIC